MKKLNGFLEAKELTIKYPGSNLILNGLNFKIYPGELIAIVGPVGCGKTTLAKSLGRTEIPDGQLFVDEIDIKNIKLDDLRKNIAIVPQEAFLFIYNLRKPKFWKTESTNAVSKRNCCKVWINGRYK